MTKSGVSLFVLLFFCILTLNLAALKVTQVPEQYELCGVAEKTADIRTHAPWIVSIYIRLGNKSKRVKFLTTGIIMSSTVILSFFSGTLTLPVIKNLAQHRNALSPEGFLIMAGLNSTNLLNVDKFTGFLEVEHVQPYTGVHESWKRFHSVLFHLKSPLEFSPYIRPTCVQFPEIRELADGTFGAVYPENITSVLNGHSYPSKNGHYDLVAMKVRILSTTECKEQYNKYYKAKLPFSVSCAQAIEPETPSFSTSCIQPNGFRLDKFYGMKNYVTGAISMVPDRKTDTCTNDTVYFVYVPSFDENNWYAKSIVCSPQFACYTEDRCVDWTKVCDSIKNCDNGEDEDEAYCSRLQQ